MKLLLCRSCGDIFNLKRVDKACGCGQSKGRYIDDLNAEIEGPCIPMGFANGSFVKALKMQGYEDAVINPNLPISQCCKGVEFTAFFIPERAKSVDRADK